MTKNQVNVRFNQRKPKKRDIFRLANVPILFKLTAASARVFHRRPADWEESLRLRRRRTPTTFRARFASVFQQPPFWPGTPFSAHARNRANISKFAQSPYKKVPLPAPGHMATYTVYSYTTKDRKIEILGDVTARKLSGSRYDAEN